MLQLQQFQQKDQEDQQDAWLDLKKPRHQEDIVKKQPMENEDNLTKKQSPNLAEVSRRHLRG